MMIPATRYRDCEAALKFLKDVFGLTEHAVYRDDTGAIQHAQMVAGSGMMMFGPPNPGPFDPYMADPGEIGGRVTTSIYVVIDDVEGHYEHVSDRGVKVLLPLKSEDYGGQSFTVADPEGHIWTFGDYDPWASQS